MFESFFQIGIGTIKTANDFFNLKINFLPTTAKFTKNVSTMDVEVRILLEKKCSYVSNKICRILLIQKLIWVLFFIVIDNRF